MTFLLDVNVLIALIDPAHVNHDAAHAFFEREGRSGWATCPLTQNGVLRIVSHPRYPNAVASPALAATVLQGLVSLPNHVFWPDDLSLIDSDRIDRGRLLSSAQVTDSYLLALAAERGGRLATFDRKLVVDAVRGGKAARHLI